MVQTIGRRPQAGQPAMFDICGPLPCGLTVLEASAGTGKTFTIAGLAARYVAAGVPLEHLLVVTFTRMATGELREGVRDRLVSAEAGLGLAIDGVAPSPTDRVLCLLATGDRAELETRRRRLATALADFDAATIATTHGFCQHILTGLGVVGDVEADVTFIEDPGDLINEVVDDLYVRHVLRRGYPGFSRSDAGEIAATVMANPGARLQPASAPVGSAWAKRVRLAQGVVDQVEDRKLRAGLLTYDDLLTRLAATLDDDDRGEAACARLRQRYRVALVDEFQDTDPVQWGILRRAFGEGDTTLVLIGDPKQAIYSFRGADVFAYLNASDTARAMATLGTNWRSDQGLITACQTLFGAARLGHADIAFRTVEAVPAHRDPGLVGAPVGTPMRIRAVHRLDGAVSLTDKEYVAKASGEEHVAADLATDVVALLRSGAELIARDEVGTEVRRQPLRPGHVAVLVRTNHQAARVRDALDHVGVPAVINGAGSVFGTPVAREWLRLLEGLERPASTARARAVALSPFVGWSATQVAEADDADLDALQEELLGWSAMLDRRGVASLLEAITRNRQLPARLLSRVDGERTLTDLRHVGQLLHAEAIAGTLGTTALTTWLRRRIIEADRDTGAEERSRRLESDAEAVQVLTIHRSKGLEFPVVYLPYLWAEGSGEDHVPVYHDQDAAGERSVDVGGKGGPDHERHRRWRKDEELGEDLRVAYVALTRSRHQVVLWWAASWGSRQSALGRLLFGLDPSGKVADELKPVPTDHDAGLILAELATRSNGTIGIERAGPAAVGSWVGDVSAPARLDVRPFLRTLDAEWRRTSYTAITSASHDPAVGSEPEHAEVADEAAAGVGGAGGGAAGAADAGGGRAGAGGEATGAAAALDAGGGRAGEGAGGDRLRRVMSPWATLPGGVATGTLVHAVLETTDFAAADIDAELTARVGEQIARRSPGFADPQGLTAALRATLETPLGPLLDHVTLRDVSRHHRLDELTFELPLAGGEAPSADLDVGTLASLLARRLTASDPLAGYAERLADPAIDQRLRGFLTGSIDLVVRRPGDPDRFTVVDYKTNWLGTEGEPLSAWHYRPAALAGVMADAHYPLQALLYAAALHRYLRWRLPDYLPERNLGGVTYLFVRGMTGPATPRVAGQPCGVFSWQPPPGLVSDLSDLLDQGGGP